MTSTSELLHQTLKKYFGFDGFRPLQEKIITAIVSGSDCLAIMPTGGGKSLCFQIPGLVLKGSIVVVSPLISLMEDQVFQLKKRGIQAEMLNSSLDDQMRKSVSDAITKGEVKFIYVSPELLQTDRWQSLTTNLPIPLVVIDEAHCISQWGHDFRPAYKSIASWLTTRHSRPTIAAFTATATDETMLDIQESLNLKSPHIFKQSELPSHLHLSVISCSDAQHKLIRMLQVLQRHTGECGIIYTLTRKAAEELTWKLTTFNFHQQWGSIAFYHGGMPAEDRASVQKQFLANKIQIIIATNAFGMGVDKPNIRFVIHYQLPNSIEAYSQEVGRAGRDRQPANCYLLALKNDLKVNFELTKNSKQKYEKLLQTISFATSKACIKKNLSEYFSLNVENENCDACSMCTPIPIASSTDSKLYRSLLSWRMIQSIKVGTDKSFLLSQFQAAMIALLKPSLVSHFRAMPGFGAGWIRDCLPLLQSGKIYETIKKKPS